MATSAPSAAGAATAIATPSSAPAEKDRGGKLLVLITGASRGLGRALAIELAKRGHTIAGCARSSEQLSELEELLSRLPHEGGVDEASSKHLFKQVDVSSDQSVEAFAKLVVQTKGVPDIIVNNAAVINRNGRIWELSAAEFDVVIDINVKGTANVIRHFLPLMKQGIIINLSSQWGRYADAHVAPYCTSKFAVEGLTQAVSKDVPEGVAIVALDPGVILTEMLQSAFGDKAQLYPTPEAWVPGAVDFILGLTPNDNGGSLTIP